VKIASNNTDDSRRPTGLRSGFTLVEVLCAIAIAAFMVAVLFAAVDGGYGVLQETRDDMRATQILMEKTEAFRLFTWPQLSNAPTTFVQYYYPNGITNSSAGTTYCGIINATGVATNIPSSAGYQANIHLITITISWTNNFAGKPVAHSRQVQTMNALGGMQSYLFGQ
jgi:prepilin-type N-terminal cleavage/methylation domain-containing protein